MNLNRRRNRKSIVERCIVAALALCASAALMSSSALAQTSDKSIIDARDANGDTPLSWASWHLRPRAILRLLTYGKFTA